MQPLPGLGRQRARKSRPLARRKKKAAPPISMTESDSESKPVVSQSTIQAALFFARAVAVAVIVAGGDFEPPQKPRVVVRPRQPGQKRRRQACNGLPRAGSIWYLRIASRAFCAGKSPSAASADSAASANVAGDRFRSARAIFRACRSARIRPRPKPCSGAARKRESDRRTSAHNRSPR